MSNGAVFALLLVFVVAALAVKGVWWPLVLLGGIVLGIGFLYSRIQTPAQRKQDAGNLAKDVKAELQYSLTGYMPGEKPYVEQFNPSKVPNELQPETWRNGPYTWNPKTRKYELTKKKGKR